MKSTDKYYEGDSEAVFRAQGEVARTVKDGLYPGGLTVEDVNALGRILAWRRASGDDSGAFEHVVDYLWMSYRIDLETKPSRRRSGCSGR